MVRSILRLSMRVATLLAMCACSGESRAPQAPRVETAAAGAPGIACRLDALYHRLGWDENGRDLQWRLALSPDGKQLAVSDYGDTRVFDFENGTQHLVFGTRPVAWSADSRSLYLLDAGFTLFAYGGGTVAPARELNGLLKASLTSGRAFDSPLLFAANDGLVAVPESSARIRVADTRTRRAFDVTTGAKRANPAYSSLRIGWDVARAEPAVFVTYEWYRRDADVRRIRIENHVDVYGRDGARRFSAETPGLEVSFLPLLVNGRVPLLSRLGEHRCVNSLGADGSVQSERACAADLQEARFGRDGRLLVTKQLAAAAYATAWPLPESLRGYAVLNFLGARGDDALVFYGARAASGAAELITVDSAGRDTRLPIGELGCELRPKSVLDAPAPAGTPIEGVTGDGFRVSGFLFRPATDAVKGLVVHLHGGPRGAATDRLRPIFAVALLEQGYAVASVNYRGGTGGGARLQTAAYGGRLDAPIADAMAIRDAALPMLPPGDRAAPVLYGESYGGYMALRAAVTGRSGFERFILDAGACDITTTQDDVSYDHARNMALDQVTDPDLALHALLLLTGPDGKAVRANLCASRLRPGVRIVVAHSKDDPNSPYERIKSFLDLQDPAARFEISCNACGHAPFALLALDQAARARAALAALEFLDTGERN